MDNTLNGCNPSNSKSLNPVEDVERTKLAIGKFGSTNIFALFTGKRANLNADKLELLSEQYAQAETLWLESKDAALAARSMHDYWKGKTGEAKFLTRSPYVQGVLEARRDQCKQRLLEAEKTVTKRLAELTRLTGKAHKLCYNKPTSLVVSRFYHADKVHITSHYLTFMEDVPPEGANLTVKVRCVRLRNRKLEITADGIHNVEWLLMNTTNSHALLTANDCKVAQLLLQHYTVAEQTGEDVYQPPLSTYEQRLNNTVINQ